MSKIRLTAKELKQVYDLFNKMNESSDYGTIELKQSNTGNGIGSVLKATMYVTHNEVEGDFTVTISDEMEW
jgi:hypothetical protein